MFLLGLAAGKRRLLEDVPALARWLPRIQWSGFLVGIPIAVWSALAAEGSLPPGYVGALTPFTNGDLDQPWTAQPPRRSPGGVHYRFWPALTCSCPNGRSQRASPSSIRCGSGLTPAR